MMGDKFVLSTILGNPGQIVGARESPRQAEKYGTREK